MADDVGYTPGAGATIAADDVGGVLYQRIKITLGADGVATGDLQGVVESGASAFLALGVGGATPHDAVDSGNPMKVGGRADSGIPTAVAVADRVNAWFGLNGQLNTRLVDGSGAAVAVGTQFAADAAMGAGAIGTQIMGRASTATPTAVSADGDAVGLWASRQGALIAAHAPHVGLNANPWTKTAKTAQYTTTQTGAALWTPAGGKKLVITEVQVQVGGTTAGTMQLWFGASGDTTYTRGTDLAIFDGEWAPSATLKPGVVMKGPWIASAADHILRVTDSAAINPLTVTVWGYEI